VRQGSGGPLCPEDSGHGAQAGSSALFGADGTGRLAVGRHQSEGGSQTAEHEARQADLEEGLDPSMADGGSRAGPFAVGSASSEADRRLGWQSGWKNTKARRGKDGARCIPVKGPAAPVRVRKGYSHRPVRRIGVPGLQWLGVVCFRPWACCPTLASPIEARKRDEETRLMGQLAARFGRRIILGL
jgi:hypothetical protein